MSPCPRDSRVLQGIPFIISRVTNGLYYRGGARGAPLTDEVPCSAAIVPPRDRLPESFCPDKIRLLTGRKLCAIAAVINRCPRKVSADTSADFASRRMPPAPCGSDSTGRDKSRIKGPEYRLRLRVTRKVFIFRAILQLPEGL